MKPNTLPHDWEIDYEGRYCADCLWLRWAVSGWCKNREAIAARGSSIPGIKNCDFWWPAERRYRRGFLGEIGFTEKIEHPTEAKP